MNELGRKAAASRADTYGSFLLGGTEFALPIAHIHEVVNSPERLTEIPLAPDYLRGVFNLRGMIIPVIDLGTILDLAAASSIETVKVAIIEKDGYLIGLRFDATGEILKTQADERNDFAERSRTVIRGVLKRDHGKRLIQMLCVDGLFELHNISLPSDPTLTQGRQSQLAKRGMRQQCISFQVGSAVCAFGINAIQEIRKVEGLNDSALAIDYCLGTMDLRGVVVPVIDFAALLGYRKADRSVTATLGDRRVIIMKVERTYLGLLVDAISSIIPYFPDELIRFPVLSNPRQEMFIGCITRQNESEVILLESSKILTQKEVVAITQGHNSLYNLADRKDEGKKPSSPRKTYITFSVDNLFAVGIEEVREILEYPDALLEPPGLPTEVHGMLNLRGELIAAVDARKLYAREPVSARSSAKILVFKSDQIRFGLIVDAVEAIILVEEAEKIRLPEFMYKVNCGRFSEDVVGAVEIPSASSGKQGVMILNVASLTGRVERLFTAS